MGEIGITIDGTDYEGWDSLSVNRNINAVCGDFQFTLADFVLDDTSTVAPGQTAEVWIKDRFGKTKLITGYLDSVSRKKSGDSTELSLSGRDKTSDLVDCAAIHKSNTWKLSTIYEIATDICDPFGIDVIPENNAAYQALNRFTIQNGETSFAAIERMCRAYSIQPKTNSDGQLVLSEIGTTKADVKLITGQNIKELSLEENESGRYSEYICRGQPRGDGSSWTPKKIQLLGEATDVGVGRYRPMVLLAEKGMTGTEIAKRAAWEAQVRAGRAIRANVTVRGWLQDAENAYGLTTRHWEVGELVELLDYDWDIEAYLVVSSVSFSLAEGEGRLTRLELCPPEIFKADPTKEIELARKSSVRPS